MLCSMYGKTMGGEVPEETIGGREAVGVGAGGAVLHAAHTSLLRAQRVRWQGQSLRWRWVAAYCRISSLVSRPSGVSEAVERWWLRWATIPLSFKLLSVHATNGHT